MLFIDESMIFDNDGKRTSDKIGDLSKLNTSEKSSLVAAVNKTNEELADIAINVKKFGAKGDGVTDDTIAFQSAVVSLSSSGGRILVPKGTYIVNYLQTKTKNIVIEGSGIGISIIKRNSNVRVIQSSGNGTNSLEIKNLTIDGAQYPQHGIRAGALKRLTIIEAEVKNCGVVDAANGAERGSIDGVFCPDVEYGFFIRSTFNDNERDGILGYPVVHMTVRDCIFERNGRFPSANQQDDALTKGPSTSKFINNYAYDCKSGGFDAETHSSMTPCYSLFDGNKVINCGNDDVGYSWGIIAGINSYGEITNNFISGLGNQSTSPAYRNGIACSGNKGTLLISGNRVVNSGRHGIFVETPNNEVIVEGNTVIGNNECGIFVYNAPDTVVKSNIVKSNKQHGIRLNLSPRAIITENVITDNSKEGSGLYSGIKSELSYNLTVSNNNVKGTLQKHCFELDSEQYTATLNMVGNQFKDATVLAFNFYGNVTTGDVFNGKKILSHTNSPFSGTYRRGDIVYNSTPSASGYIGWICITGGEVALSVWAASTTYTVGILRYTGTNVYKVTIPGTSGIVAPTHISGTAVDGTVTWQYVGTLAVFKGFGSIQA